MLIAMHVVRIHSTIQLSHFNVERERVDYKQIQLITISLIRLHRHTNLNFAINRSITEGSIDIVVMSCYESYETNSILASNHHTVHVESRYRTFQAATCCSFEAAAAAATAAAAIPIGQSDCGVQCKLCIVWTKNNNNANVKTHTTHTKREHFYYLTSQQLIACIVALCT